MTKVLPIRYAPSGELGELEVDGHDLSRLVSRVSIDHAAGEFPRVYLELKKGTPVEEVALEGVVHVKETVLQDPAEACLAFLEPIDPGELERACLAAMELGGAQSFGDAALAVLRGWARGD